MCLPLDPKIQKPNPAVDNFKLDITLFDGAQKVIGNSGVAGPSDAPAGVPVVIGPIGTTTLPGPMSVTAGNVDDNPLSFSIGGDSFASNTDRCTVGRYDGGRREIDCGFAC